MEDSAGVRLITSAGARPYPETRYRWEGREAASPYACVAMAQLLNLAGARATVILTEAAYREHWAALSRALQGVGLAPEAVCVPEGRSPAEQQEIVEAVMSHVEPGERIVLDVTLGLRHLPFVYFAALTYLVGLQKNRLDGIFYGAFELKDASGAAPILNLTGLFRLVEWHQALGAAEESGDLRPVARMLRQEAGELFRRAQGSPQLSQAADAVRDLSQALAVGAPLEVGLEASRVMEALERLQQMEVTGGPARRVLRQLETDLRTGRWGGFATEPAPESKDAIRLNQDELRRQLRLARWYAEGNDHARVLLLLREWMVNLVLWTQGEADRWLRRDARRRAERKLGSLRYRAEKGVASDVEKRLGTLWDQITSRRNPVAHAGMTLAAVRPKAQTAEAEKLLAACELLAASPFPAGAEPEHGGRVLVSPLGLSPGVLFTAVRRLAPDRLILLTSEQALPSVDEALTRAGRADLPRKVLILQDPFTGFRELKDLLDQEVFTWLAGAREVVANVTGGPTVMQHAVERLAEEARRLGTQPRRCALIDRRPAEEQKRAPYVEGDLFWLDDEPEDAD